MDRLFSRPWRRTLQRQPVHSSSIASVGYDASTRTLEVEFRHGAVYRYLDVEPAAHDALLAADSLGRHLNLVIKGNYDYIKA